MPGLTPCPRRSRPVGDRHVDAQTSQGQREMEGWRVPPPPRGKVLVTFEPMLSSEQVRLQQRKGWGGSLCSPVLGPSVPHCPLGSERLDVLTPQPFACSRLFRSVGCVTLWGASAPGWPWPQVTLGDTAGKGGRTWQVIQLRCHGALPLPGPSGPLGSPQGS